MVLSWCWCCQFFFQLLFAAFMRPQMGLQMRRFPVQFPASPTTMIPRNIFGNGFFPRFLTFGTLTAGRFLGDQLGLDIGFGWVAGGCGWRFTGLLSVSRRCYHWWRPAVIVSIRSLSIVDKRVVKLTGRAGICRRRVMAVLSDSFVFYAVHSKHLHSWRVGLELLSRAEIAEFVWPSHSGGQAAPGGCAASRRRALSSLGKSKMLNRW